MINNVKAPRYRPKVKVTLDNDFLEYLYDKHPVFKYKYSKKEIKNVVKTFNTTMVDGSINHRDGVEMPVFNRLFQLISFKPTEEVVVIDFQKSIEHKQTITQNNTDTNGYMLKITSSHIPRKLKVENDFLYYLKPYRGFARKASKLFKDNWNIYASVKFNTECFMDYKKGLSLNNYNEFEL